MFVLVVPLGVFLERYNALTGVDVCGGSIFTKNWKKGKGKVGFFLHLIASSRG